MNNKMFNSFEFIENNNNNIYNNIINFLILKILYFSILEFRVHPDSLIYNINFLLSEIEWLENNNTKTIEEEQLQYYQNYFKLFGKILSKYKIINNKIDILINNILINDIIELKNKKYFNTKSTLIIIRDSLLKDNYFKKSLLDFIVSNWMEINFDFPHNEYNVLLNEYISLIVDENSYCIKFLRDKIDILINNNNNNSIKVFLNEINKYKHSKFTFLIKYNKNKEEFKKSVEHTDLNNAFYEFMNLWNDHLIRNLLTKVYINDNIINNIYYYDKNNDLKRYDLKYNNNFFNYKFNDLCAEYLNKDYISSNEKTIISFLKDMYLLSYNTKNENYFDKNSKFIKLWMILEMIINKFGSSNDTKSNLIEFADVLKDNFRYTLFANIRNGYNIKFNDNLSHYSFWISQNDLKSKIYDNIRKSILSNNNFDLISNFNYKYYLIKIYKIRNKYIHNNNSKFINVNLSDDIYEIILRIIENLIMWIKFFNNNDENFNDDFKTLFNKVKYYIKWSNNKNIKNEKYIFDKFPKYYFNNKDEEDDE